jgi:predicted nucleic acid-binding protein
VPRRIVFLDTSFIVGLAHAKDSHHERAKLLDAELLREKALSVLHWGVLMEIADGFARADRRAKGYALLERLETEDRYHISPITDELLAEALAMYRARTDKEWGLTDCISFVMMQQEGMTEALTADIHFRQAGFKALLLDAL